MAPEPGKCRGVAHRTLLMSICLSLLPPLAFAAHENCSDCHTEGKELRQPEITPLCLSCHSGGNRNDHKVGIAPTGMKTPLPLDSERKIACITCHDQHGKGGAPRLLRMKTNDLCLNCHDK